MSGNVSDCSDDSFEIVSAETCEEQSSVITSVYKPSVMFQDMFDVYPLDTDIVARISFFKDFEKEAEDRVVLLPVAWESLDQGLCTVEMQGNYVKFDVKDLPKTSADKFFQLCYSSSNNTVKGVSAPFSFREVHEDELMEFQKEQNKEFWTFRSRFAILMNTFWNSLVECERTIDVERKKVVFVDTGVNPSQNIVFGDIVENRVKTVLSDDENVTEKSKQSKNGESSIPLIEIEESKLNPPTVSDDNACQQTEQSGNLTVNSDGTFCFTVESFPWTEFNNSKSNNDSVIRNLLTSQPENEDVDNTNVETKSDSSSLAVNVEESFAEDDPRTLFNSKFKVKPIWKPIEPQPEEKTGLDSALRVVDHCRKEDEVKLETSLKNLRLDQKPRESEYFRDVLFRNSALQSELNRQKLKEVSLLSQLQDYEHLKSSNRALTAELTHTREFLDYMIEQKDERLRDMACAERNGHLYVYETMKSQYRKRRGRKVTAESIIERLKDEMNDMQTQLENTRQELTKEKERTQELQKLMTEKEQNYAAQLVNLTFRNEKLSDECNLLKNDYEHRLKQGAKAFARLSLKHQRLVVRLSDHSYSVSPSSTSGQPSTSSSR